MIIRKAIQQRVYPGLEPRSRENVWLSEAEALTMNMRDLILESRRNEEWAVIQRLSQSDILEPHPAQRVAKDGRIVEVWLTASILMNGTGNIYAITTTERERGSEKQTES